MKQIATKLALLALGLAVAPLFAFGAAFPRRRIAPGIEG